MNLKAFLGEREPGWSELEGLLGSARRRPERLGPEGVRRLGSLYRSTAADLALARRRFGADPVVARLEDLVTRARAAVYQAEPRRGSLASFAATGYWRAVRERPGLLLVAWSLLLLPALAAALWGYSDPGAAVGVVPAALSGGPESGDLDLSHADQAAFSSQIFTNNIRVSFLAFAGGIALGLGTALVLVLNGLMLGALAGIVFVEGKGSTFVELVAPHGPLELSCIAVSAVAGLRIGLALIDPGPRARQAALIAESRRGVEIVLGTAVWLVVAGLVEGYLTPLGIGVGAALGVGFALAAIYWWLVLWRGRPAAAGPGRRGVGADRGLGADRGAGGRGRPTGALAPSP